MLTPDQLTELRGHMVTNNNKHHADILDLLYEINCKLVDVEQICEAAEEIIDAAGRFRDEADLAVMNAQRDAEDTRADDRLNTMKADEID